MNTTNILIGMIERGFKCYLKNLVNLTFEQLQKYTFAELEFIDTFQIIPTKTSIYNIEFFTNQFVFLSAVQLSKIEYEQDYLDISKKQVISTKYNV